VNINDDLEYAAQELALLDGACNADEALKAGVAVLAALKAATIRASLQPVDLPQEGWRHGFSFGIQDHRVLLEFIPNDRQFVIGVSREKGQPPSREPVPLVFDPITRTFVGMEFDNDIGLAPGEYRPRKSAMRVLVEMVQGLVQGPTAKT
jgi:hypothetical protein